MGRGISFISDKLNIIGGALSGIFVLVMGLIVTYEVIMRYVFRSPTIWVLEISIYLTIGSVFLGGGYALKEKMHINVDVITRYLSQRNQVLLQIISLFNRHLLFCFDLVWCGNDHHFPSYVGSFSHDIGNTGGHSAQFHSHRGSADPAGGNTADPGGDWGLEKNLSGRGKLVGEKPSPLVVFGSVYFFFGLVLFPKARPFGACPSYFYSHLWRGAHRFLPGDDGPHRFLFYLRWRSSP